MQVELKKVKFHEDMSDETNCFSADLWVDGKYLAHVSNDGQGGDNRYDIQQHHAWKTFEKWCRALPPLPPAPDFPLELPMNPDLYISGLFDAWLTKDCDRREKAMIKRACKTKTVYRLKGDKPDVWRTIKHVYDATVKAYMQAKYGDRIESIANEGVPA